MMMWMFRRRRKMMMLRRKTDPKTGKHTLCEPAQSKCGWTSREAFCLLIYKENEGRSSRGKHFVQACAVGMHMDMSQEACCGGIYLDIAGRF